MRPTRPAQPVARCSKLLRPPVVLSPVRVGPPVEQNKVRTPSYASVQAAPVSSPVAPTARPHTVWLTVCDRLRPHPWRCHCTQPRNRQACQELYATKKVRTPTQPRLCTGVSGRKHLHPPWYAQKRAGSSELQGSPVTHSPRRLRPPRACAHHACPVRSEVQQAAGAASDPLPGTARLHVCLNSHAARPARTRCSKLPRPNWPTPRYVPATRGVAPYRLQAPAVGATKPFATNPCDGCA